MFRVTPGFPTSVDLELCRSGAKILRGFVPWPSDPSCQPKVSLPIFIVQARYGDAFAGRGVQKFAVFKIHAHVSGEGSGFEEYEIAGDEVALHDLYTFIGHLGCFSGQGYAEPVPIGDVYEARAVHAISGHAAVPVTHVFPGIVLRV